MPTPPPNIPPFVPLNQTTTPGEFLLRSPASAAALGLGENFIAGQRNKIMREGQRERARLTEEGLDIDRKIQEQRKREFEQKQREFEIEQERERARMRGLEQGFKAMHDELEGIPDPADKIAAMGKYTGLLLDPDGARAFNGILKVFGQRIQTQMDLNTASGMAKEQEFRNTLVQQYGMDPNAERDSDQWGRAVTAKNEDTLLKIAVNEFGLTEIPKDRGEFFRINARGEVNEDEMRGWLQKVTGITPSSTTSQSGGASVTRRLAPTADDEPFAVKTARALAEFEENRRTETDPKKKRQLDTMIGMLKKEPAETEMGKISNLMLKTWTEQNPAPLPAEFENEQDYADALRDWQERFGQMVEQSRRIRGVSQNPGDLWLGPSTGLSAPFAVPPNP